MKVNFGMSNRLRVELEARWRCCCWALLLAEVSLTLTSGLVGSLGKAHESVAPFLGGDHKWVKREESNTVSIQARYKAAQHQAWSFFSRLPPISSAAAFAARACQLQHFFSLICN